MSSPALGSSTAPRPSLDRVFDVLEEQGHQPRRQALLIQAACPLHEDPERGFTARWKPARGGSVHLDCRSCSARQPDLREALSLAPVDLLDTPTGRGHTLPRQTAEPAGNRLGPLPRRLTAAAAPAPLTSAGMGADAVGAFTPVAGVAAAAIAAHGAAVWLTGVPGDLDPLGEALRGAGSDVAVSVAADCADAIVAQLAGVEVVLTCSGDLAGYRWAVDLSNRLGGVAESIRRVVLVASSSHSVGEHLAAGRGMDDFVELSTAHAQLLATSVESEAAAASVEAEAGQVQSSLDEVRARLKSAAAARKRKASSMAKTDALRAVRWAHEAVKHVRLAQTALDRTRALDAEVGLQLAAGEPPVVLPGVDAVRRAVSAHDVAQRLAQYAWDECGAPMPESIQQVLARALPDAAPAAPEVDESPGGEVLPFPSGGSDGDDGTRRPGSPVRWAEYERLPSGLAERRYTRNGDTYLQGLLSLDVRILQQEYTEVEPFDEAEVVIGEPRPADGVVAEHHVVNYVLGYTHPQTGELIRIRVSAERARMGDWLAELPQTGVQYDATVRGRAKVWAAIRAMSRAAEIVTTYRTTGWRDIPGHGWTYIHAGGGITAAGAVQLPVSLPGTLSRVEFPLPLQDPAQIRRLFDEHSRALMTRVKPYVGAVLCGTAYRAVLGWTGPVTMAYGVPGSFKSSVASLTMHHFGTRWDRSLPTVSMSGEGGSTLQAIRDEMWAAKDCLMFSDDAAPDKGVNAAAAFLGQLVRMQYNREKRDRKDRKDPDKIIPGKSSRCTFLATSEVQASAESGVERTNVLDLAKGELDLDTIIELDQPASRHGRATVMASLLAWMASTDVAELKQWRRARVEVIARRRRDAGADARVAEPFAELEVGWELMGRFLSNIGAYSEAEVEQMLDDVRVALSEAEQRGQDPDSPSSIGERCRQYIASALRAGAIHVSAVGGVEPAMPDALRYGYRRVVGPDAQGKTQVRIEPRGEKAGVVTRSVHGRRLHVDPNVMLPVILNVARQAGEPLQAGRTVIQRELATAGMLRTWNDGSGVRYTCKVPDINGIPGGQDTLWDLDERAIFGGGPTDPDPDGPPPVPDLTPPPPPDLAPAVDETTSDPAAGGSVGVEPDDEVLMPEFTEDTVLHGGPTTSCCVCGTPTSRYVDGYPAHALCWKNSSTPPASAPAIPVNTPIPARGVCLDCGQPTSNRAGRSTFRCPPCTSSRSTAVAAVTAAPVEVAAPAAPTARPHAPTSSAPAAAAAPAPSTPAAEATSPDPVDDAPTVTTGPVEPISVEVPGSGPAVAGPATTTPRRPATRPAAPAAGPGRRPAAAVASAWNYSSVVVDVDGIYLPDGTIAAPEPVATIADLAAIGEQFKIGHIAGAGLIVVTTALAAQLELLPTEDALTADLPTGEPPTEDDMVDRIKDFLAHQTAFLSNDDGWTADGDTLRAWTRIRRENRAFRIVIEPVVWIWDRRVDSASPFIDLPDVDLDPVGCWRELARRLERLAELLGVPWSTSPGATGEAIYEQIQRSRSRKGGKVLDAAGPIPPADFAGQVRLEGEFAWRRRPAPAELAAAVVVHKYDKRASYLATAGGTDLGFGEPVHTDAAGSVAAVNAARSGATKTKMPYGIWLVNLPAWEQPTPPPHPEQRTFEPVRRWVTTATLVLLLDDEDNGGAGYTVDDLGIEQSWLWPDQARFLEPWYTRCRDALLAARSEGDTAVATAVKGVYTGYIGRLASQFTATGPRPWHHQPVWEATIRALARASLWRSMQKHHLATGRIPVGIDHDEIGYLDDTLDPTVNPPAADTGRLGALKPSGSVALDGPLRKKLAEGGSALDKQLEHLSIAAGEGAG